METNHENTAIIRKPIKAKLNIIKESRLGLFSRCKLLTATEARGYLFIDRGYRVPVCQENPSDKLSLLLIRMCQIDRFEVPSRDFLQKAMGWAKGTILKYLAEGKAKGVIVEYVLVGVDGRKKCMGYRPVTVLMPYKKAGKKAAPQKRGRHTETHRTGGRINPAAISPVGSKSEPTLVIQRTPVSSARGIEEGRPSSDFSLKLVVYKNENITNIGSYVPTVSNSRKRTKRTSSECIQLCTTTYAEILKRLQKISHNTNLTGATARSLVYRIEESGTITPATVAQMEYHTSSRDIKPVTLIYLVRKFDTLLSDPECRRELLNAAKNLMSEYRDVFQKHRMNDYYSPKLTHLDLCRDMYQNANATFTRNLQRGLTLEGYVWTQPPAARIQACREQGQHDLLSELKYSQNDVMRGLDFASLFWLRMEYIKDPVSFRRDFRFDYRMTEDEVWAYIRSLAERDFASIGLNIDEIEHKLEDLDDYQFSLLDMGEFLMPHLSYPS